MAGFDPIKVDAVARAPYALTLWTFLQRAEEEYMRSLSREIEQIRGADMIATAFHDPKKLSRFEQDWRKRALDQTPATARETREEIEAWANDLFLEYQRAKRRPVS